MKLGLVLSLLAFSGCAFKSELRNPLGKTERLSLEIEAANLSSVAPDVLSSIEPLIAHVISPTAGIAAQLGAGLPLVLPGPAHTILMPPMAPTPEPTPDPRMEEVLSRLRAMEAWPEPGDLLRMPPHRSSLEAAPEPMCYVNPGGEAYHQPECKRIKDSAERMPCSEARIRASEHRPCKTCGGSR